jgi:hypothetical protein
VGEEGEGRELNDYSLQTRRWHCLLTSGTRDRDLGSRELISLSHCFGKRPSTLRARSLIRSRKGKSPNVPKLQFGTKRRKASSKKR